MNRYTFSTDVKMERSIPLQIGSRVMLNSTIQNLSEASKSARGVITWIAPNGLIRVQWRRQDRIGTNELMSEFLVLADE